LSTGSPKGAWRHVLRTEALGLLRDRRALFAGLVLPMLLYPLLFLGQGWLADVGRETLEAREVVIAHELSAADPEVSARFLARLAEEQPIELRALEPGSCAALLGRLDEQEDEARAAARVMVAELLDPDGHVLVLAGPDPEAPGNTRVQLAFDGADETAQEAEGRVHAALRSLRSELEAERLEQLFGGDPAAAWVSESRDLASGQDRGGAWIGRLLPLIAVLILLSGGSYAALAAFAGEREAGTLETLLVQPVPSLQLVWGKFAAVLGTGLALLVLNVASLSLCAILGLGTLGGEGGELVGPSVTRVLGAGLLLLPVCLLMCAVLCLVCGKARSFREGQHYGRPLTLVAMLPTAIAALPEVELDALLAVVPLAGPALAFREAMVGGLAPLPGALAFGSTLLYALWALRHVGGLLEGERVLASASSEVEDRQRRVQSGRALNWGWTGVFAVYLVGGLLQSWRPLPGLLLTLWVLLPVLAVLAARGTARRAGEPLVDTLALRPPPVQHGLGALLAAPFLAWVATHGIEWQQSVMPLPRSMTEGASLPAGFDALSPTGLFLVMALSPGVCEELFFRGAVLSGLRRDLPSWKIVVWQAVLFGAVHASIYRFLPTAILGALLALITLRSRSLFPAVILHVAYNGSLVLGEAGPLGADLVRFCPWLAIPAAALLALPARRDWDGRRRP